MKYEEIDHIYESYINGQRRQMVEQIRSYGVIEFFGYDFAPWINDYHPNTPELYTAVCMAYHKIVDPGMLVSP